MPLLIDELIVFKITQPQQWTLEDQQAFSRVELTFMVEGETPPLLRVLPIKGPDKLVLTLDHKDNLLGLMK